MHLQWLVLPSEHEKPSRIAWQIEILQVLIGWLPDGPETQLKFMSLLQQSLLSDQ